MVKLIDGITCRHLRRYWYFRNEPVLLREKTTVMKSHIYCSYCEGLVMPPQWITAFNNGPTITTNMPAHAVHEYLERQKHVANYTIRKTNNGSAYAAKR